MVWKRLGALVVFPLQMIYLVVKAAVGLVLPAKLRDLSRENVLITGGGRGIGRQLAREFAERGARKIVLWGRTEKCLKETTEEIRQMGTECHYFICDVGNREEVYQTAKAVREKVSQPLSPTEAGDSGPEDSGSCAAQPGPPPPPMDDACPRYLKKEGGATHLPVL
ncbi:short-chain dehydrogenase/reductase 3 isoform X8 [Macaca fascicularis]|uniref:short-chain dehydrogenase/reductase 3 isoform X8 n=1 Tax=Macaca fascicularis TaxID=9541 RepID=UPI003D15B548